MSVLRWITNVSAKSSIGRLFGSRHPGGGGDGKSVSSSVSTSSSSSSSSSCSPVGLTVSASSRSAPNRSSGGAVEVAGGTVDGSFAEKEEEADTDVEDDGCCCCGGGGGDGNGPEKVAMPEGVASRRGLHSDQG